MKYKITILILIFIIIGVFFHFELDQYLTLEYVKSNQERFQHYYQNNTFKTLVIYMLVYIITTALSLPGATILTLAGGALFGFMTSLVIVSFASTIGATLAFLASRFFLKDYVQRKFGKYLRIINEGIEKEGAFYLFSMRLIPIFPFFMINLVMGLTPIKISTYFLVSQLGMLAGTAVFVNAGLQLSHLDSLSDILSPRLIGSFALLGIFPLCAKKVLNFISVRKD